MTTTTATPTRRTVTTARRTAGTLHALGVRGVSAVRYRAEPVDSPTAHIGPAHPLGGLARPGQLSLLEGADVCQKCHLTGCDC